MKINLNVLPKDILERFPLSIRVNNIEYDLKDLPDDLRVLVEDYLAKKPPEINYSDTVRDVRPVITVYNDLQPLNIKDTAIEYFKNYLMVSEGTYPFDVTFGCKLRKYLQTKDTHLMNILISNELNNIIDALNNDYNLNLKLRSAKVYSSSNPSALMKDPSASYILLVEVEIENQVITVRLQY